MNAPSPQSDASSRLNAVRERIRRACVTAGRPDTDVSLLAVSKTWDAERVLELAALGQRAFGENYLQEALAKIETCAARQAEARDATGTVRQGEAGRPAPIEWHFIGPIQSNKTRPIAEHFDWVHSIDREKIAARLSEQRPTQRSPLQVCVQVNVSDEASKSGCEPGEAAALALKIAQMPGLHLRGLMAIPEPTDDPAIQRARFATLRELAKSIAGELQAIDPALALRFDTLSMGMSDDLEAAIAEGATLVRVGTALFGRRQTLTEASVRPST